MLAEVWAFTVLLDPINRRWETIPASRFRVCWRFRRATGYIPRPRPHRSRGVLGGPLDGTQPEARERRTAPPRTTYIVPQNMMSKNLNICMNRFPVTLVFNSRWVKIQHYTTTRYVLRQGPRAQMLCCELVVQKDHNCF